MKYQNVKKYFPKRVILGVNDDEERVTTKSLYQNHFSLKTFVTFTLCCVFLGCCFNFFLNKIQISLTRFVTKKWQKTAHFFYFFHNIDYLYDVNWFEGKNQNGLEKLSL